MPNRRQNPPALAMPERAMIRVRGARQNNLQGIDLDLPRGLLHIITGPSGSGKSSLAFDTIYAEGQRRYIETFSPYTRQFFDRMDKPRADSIEGIPPAIAIEQSNSVKTTRSTVGTITEINDYLKLLFPRIASASCPCCKRTIRPETSRSIIREAIRQHHDATLLVTFPISTGDIEKRTPSQLFDFLKQQGYLRIWLDKKIVRTDEPPPINSLPPTAQIIQDRVACSDESRLTEAVETALRLGKGRVELINEASGESFPFSSGWHCAWCDISIRPPTPGLFSFNHPLGACPECRGFGRTIGLDWQRIIPDPSRTISEGLVRPFQSGMAQECQNDLLRYARRRNLDLHCPYDRLSKVDQDWIVYGEARPEESVHDVWDSGRWYGVKGYFDWLESKTYKMHVRVLLSRYRNYNKCASCNGGRFQPDTLNFHIKGADNSSYTLPEIAAQPIKSLRIFFESISVPEKDHTTALILEQITSRLNYLAEVGLSYLTLDRPTRTLSGGEVQRVNLTTCLGASLVNTLFVMDEPSVGLHPRDIDQLLGIMRKLRDNGNTLLVVEHEESVMRAADWLSDIGPGRGETGGNLVFSAPLSEIHKATNSPTADFLLGRRHIPIPSKRRKARKFLRLRGASLHNIKKLDIDFPLGVFNCVTGVSGSGKTTLVHGLLHRNLLRERGEPVEEESGTIKKLVGIEHVGEVIMIDQSPPGKSSRSTPVVYIGAWDHIRDLFAHLPSAKAAGLNASSFSFNSNHGRCERCSGLGYERVEMQFLSDISLVCSSCDGQRFQPHILRIKLNGYSVHDILEMSVSKALTFFKSFPKHHKITDPLQVLEDVGLGYLRLGQPTSFLSGGESQRLKLASHLADTESEASLLLFDEPTTGLHLDDIDRLLGVFNRLVEAGHTLVVIEHNIEVVKCADHVIDMGPEAGDEGGSVVAVGTPEVVANCQVSRTAPFLRAALNPHKSQVATIAEPPPPPILADNHLIRVSGAREHNLKNISLDIPRDEFVVVTGLSGSGKSSIAFDVLFAEGQRRFLDCMSPYARQFVEQIEKPDVDHINGLPPAVAIEQRISRGGGKSTVATVTEIYHFLRLLFSKLGTQHCPTCHVPVGTTTLAEVAERLRTFSAKGSVQVFAPLVKSRKGYHKDIAAWAVKNDYDKLLVDGHLIKTDQFPELSRYSEHSIDVLIGTIRDANEEEALDLARRALDVGKNTARLVLNGTSELLSTEMSCPSCARAFEPLDPRMFSFNSPHGRCESCHGFGLIYDRDFNSDQAQSEIEADLKEEEARENSEDDSTQVCPDCDGIRLNAEARNVFVLGRPIRDFIRSSAREAVVLFDSLDFKGNDATVAADIIPEIRQRLGFMRRVGLDYLTLERPATTLSGGEAQRIRLAAQLGSNLRGVLYVLDEPTIGLHERDNRSLLDALSELVAQGNSLLIVEHDEETMRRASHIIDLGPGAGTQGGQVVASGTLDQILASKNSLTGKLLANPPQRPSRGQRRPLNSKGLPWIELKGAKLHNLKNINVRIPIGRLSVACGISGSGKSSLFRGTLIPALKETITRRGRKPLHKATTPPFSELLGADHVSAVHMVDQSPIGKTSRSTPATYIKVFDHIRQLFATLPASRMRGYTPSRFSFNTDGGRCETCLGHGATKLEMSFLPTSWLPCTECNGSRYNSQTLDITYNGKTIADVMAMTAAEAATFFSAHPKVHRTLNYLVETGLGYLTLGQPSPTLSGGESQRIKLVTELSRANNHNNLYLLEEPTIGLHMADVEQLIALLHRLTDEGHTVVVIEHNLSVIAEADYTIEIGPEAGEEGGYLVAAGTPEMLAQTENSPTAPFLKEVLAHSR